MLLVIPVFSYADDNQPSAYRGMYLQSRTASQRSAVCLSALANLRKDQYRRLEDDENLSVAFAFAYSRELGAAWMARSKDEMDQDFMEAATRLTDHFEKRLKVDLPPSWKSRFHTVQAVNDGLLFPSKLRFRGFTAVNDECSREKRGQIRRAQWILDTSIDGLRIQNVDADGTVKSEIKVPETLRSYFVEELRDSGEAQLTAASFASDLILLVPQVGPKGSTTLARVSPTKGLAWKSTVKNTRFLWDLEAHSDSEIVVDSNRVLFFAIAEHSSSISVIDIDSGKLVESFNSMSAIPSVGLKGIIGATAP